jgi:hypothetical protein
MVVAWPLAFLGAMEILPHWCVWLCLLSLPDGMRRLLKKNVHALRHVVFKAFDVWFQIGCLAWEMVFFTISVGGDPALTCLIFVFAFMVITTGVLGDADLTPRCVKGGGSLLISIIFFILVLAFAVLLTTGAFPRAANVTIPVHFLNTDMNMGSITAATRALSFNLLFLGKYAVKKFLRPNHCALVEVGVVKVTIKRSELDASMQAANRRRSVVGRQGSMKRIKAYQVAPAMADE